MNQALSLRLQTAASLVDKCATLADIGCDHGFLSIELLERGICDRAILCDVNAGPLKNASLHVKDAGLLDRCDLRLGNGLEKLSVGEADTIAILGMGGILMKDILIAGREVARGAKSLVLSPQSEIPEFRKFLTQEGYRIDDEAVVFDMGKYYFLIKCHYTGEKLFINEKEAYVGKKNLLRASEKGIEDRPVELYNYLRFRENILQGILEKTHGTDRGTEIYDEIKLVQDILMDIS